MLSYDYHLYDYSKQWVGKIKHRSVLITSGGYSYRELFFDKLDAEFQLFKENVERAVTASYH